MTGQHKILLNNYEYTIYVFETCDCELLLALLDPNRYLGTLVKYIPCGDKRYDYEIVGVCNNMDENTVENLLDKFTEMVVDDV